MAKTRKISLGKSFFIVLVLVILIVVITSIYLFSQFRTGDFVYNDETGLVGEVKGVSLPKDYLVQWQDGSLSKESLFNLKKLNELNDLEVLQILEKEKTPEIYFYPGELEEGSVEELVSIKGLGGTEVIPKLSGKGNFILMLGEKGCKPNFVCSDWGKCQAVYDVESLTTERLVSSLQYRYCKDYSKCISDFVDSKKCITKVPITTRKIQIGEKEYMEVYDKDKLLISRLALIEEDYDKLDIQILFDESAYPPYCYDNIKNFDEDDIDCVYEQDGVCPSCKQKFYALKGNYLLMLIILISLIILCLIFLSNPNSR